MRSIMGTASAVKTTSLLGAACLFALSNPAQANVIETATINNSYSYVVGSQSGGDPNASGNERFFLSDLTNGFASDVGLSLTATLDEGSFFFLHQGYCVGRCSVTIGTDIVFTLTNNANAPATLRFDSQITPGHLSRSNFLSASPQEGAAFDFAVTQGPGEGTTLYAASGSVGAGIPQVFTTADPFNNLLRDDNPPEWNVLDWSATNLNLTLAPIPGGQSTLVRYRSLLTIFTDNPFCPDTNECTGFQGAFGDPRERGGVIVQSAAAGFAAFAESFGEAAPFASPPIPAVGAIYDPFRVTYAFVPVGTPLPLTPLAIGPIPYNIPYRAVNVIPEPETWAMMLLGFASLGAVIRRRRGQVSGTPVPA